MKKWRMKKTKEGAASFYIVAFSTLILLILAVSFATVIISEIERTSNDDLAQSAYDSAMAGVEDAKLAFYNYQNCKAKNFDDNLSRECKQIIALMEQPEKRDCYMVARILGRISYDGSDNAEENEVKINEFKYNETGPGSNNMEQAYTCVKIQTILSDYRATLSGSDSTRVIKVNVDDGAQAGGTVEAANKIAAKDIKKIRLSWYSGTEDRNYKNFDGTVTFPQIAAGGASIPPTIFVGLIQTAKEFALSDFETTVNVGGKGTTDRGMLYLVPSENEVLEDGDTYKAVIRNATTKVNEIPASAFLQSNKQESKNLPYVVHCPKDDDGEFACSVTIDLPDVVPHNGNSTRSDDTFMFVVGLPYGRPNTDFSLELFCDEGKTCGGEVKTDEDGNKELVNKNQANFSGVQVKIDSTGRANDLYRRVEVRMESAADSAYISMIGPLELTDDISGDGTGGGNAGTGANFGLNKNYTVTKEWNITTPVFQGRLQQR